MLLLGSPKRESSGRGGVQFSGSGGERPLRVGGSLRLAFDSDGRIRVVAWGSKPGVVAFNLPDIGYSGKAASHKFAVQ
jgi:hypothetical protein